MEREIIFDSRLYFNFIKYICNFFFNINVCICKYVICIVVKDFLIKYIYFE